MSVIVAFLVDPDGDTVFPYVEGKLTDISHFIPEGGCPSPEIALETLTPDFGALELAWKNTDGDLIVVRLVDG